MPNFGTSEYVLYKLWYAPAVPTELGAQRKYGGTLKKFPVRSLWPQFQNCVSAYDQTGLYLRKSALSGFIAYSRQSRASI